MRAIALSILLVLPCLVNASEPKTPLAGISLKQDRQVVGKSAVTGKDTLITITASGTAFGVDLSSVGMPSKKLLMTVAHNITTNEKLVIEPVVQIGDTWHKTTLLYMDEELDVALLEVIGDVELPNRLEISKADAKPGNPVVLDGGIRGQPIKRRDGVVAKLRWFNGSPTIWTLVTLVDFDHGDSGGPLLGADGKVVGMASRGISIGDGHTFEEGKGLFLPSSIIWNFVEEYVKLRKENAKFKATQDKAKKK